MSCDADVGDRRAERAHRERHHVHRAAPHGAAEQVGRASSRISGGVAPVVGRDRRRPRWLGADEGAVLDPGDVAGIGARPGSSSGRLASASRSKVPASTSCWQRRSYSSAEPSHQWTASGSVSSAISSTQAERQHSWCLRSGSRCSTWVGLVLLARGPKGVSLPGHSQLGPTLAPGRDRTRQPRPRGTPFRRLGDDGQRGAPDRAMRRSPWPGRSRSRRSWRSSSRAMLKHESWTTRPRVWSSASPLPGRLDRQDQAAHDRQDRLHGGGHRHRRSAARAPGHYPTPRCRASAARWRSPGTGPPTARPSATSTS